MRTSALRMRTGTPARRGRALPARNVAVGAVAVLTLTVAGCTGSPRPEPTTPATPVGAEESRRLVQDYLDAMAAKDVDTGRAQLCSATREIFDASATGPNGDFAESFLVSGTEIVSSRQVPVGHEVTATVTVAVGADTTPVGLVFTVTPVGAGDGDWCIHDETTAPTDQPSGAGTAPASGPPSAPAGEPGTAPAGEPGTAPAG